MEICLRRMRVQDKNLKITLETITTLNLQTQILNFIQNNLKIFILINKV